MKLIIAFILFFSIGLNSVQSHPIENETGKKEMLVSLPFLSDKNAAIFDNGLKQLSGIISVKVSYELKVMIIEFNPSLQSEENILKSMRSQETNTSIEQLNNSDIPKIKNRYAISTIR